MRSMRPLRILPILALWAVGSPAPALEPAEAALPESVALAEPPGLADLDVSHGLRLSRHTASLSAFGGGYRSSVFTSLYWSRAYEERAQLAERFGLHWAYGLSLDEYDAHAGVYAGHSPLGYPEDRKWSAKPMAGLQFSRQDLLFRGDHLNIRATSDMQRLFREIGVFRSAEEVDALSLLGWRSNSSLTWELGDPVREIQWQFTARFDRRAYSQSNTANFSLTRRF
jgi:hypothetical protein